MDLSSQNNGFGPLCKPRSETVLLTVAVLGLAAFVGLVEVAEYVLKPMKILLSYKNTEPIHLLSIYCAMTSSLILGEIVRRLTFFVEEVRHTNERYNGSRVKAFKKCMNFGKRTKVVYGIFAFTTLIPCLYHLSFDESQVFPFHIYIAYGSLSSLIMFVIGAKKLSQAELSHLAETENKNIADGLAWSYYYGYLKLVLPHLHEQLTKAVAPDYLVDGNDMCDAVVVKKLFIIISKKCNCYKGLIEVDKGHIQKEGNLPAFYLTRAGVELRPYQHCLYRVTAKDKPAIFVILEFATPLLAMNDMCNDQLSDFTEEDRDTQVMAFYNKLKFILEHGDEDIRDRYKLVLISDVYTEGERHLSDVIYEAVSEASLNLS